MLCKPVGATSIFHIGGISQAAQVVEQKPAGVNGEVTVHLKVVEFG